MREQRPTLLIVDDQPANIHALAKLLKDDYRIITATNAAKALELARREPGPDLILLDILMPDQDGYAICRELKADEAIHAIPVIFVTALDQAQDEAKGLQLGAADYISKPFNPTIVRARVHNQVSLKLKTDLLEQIALQDGLTEIPNRRYFDRKLAQEWNRQSRHQQPLSLLMIDIDHFKPYNDHYGHGAGDDCLRRVAQALQQVPKRAADLVARYGGEEFVALLPETDSIGARQVAGRMQEAIHALALPHAYSPVADRITISIGASVSLAGQPATSSEALKQAADQALYQAKEQGRNRLVWDSPNPS
ncbi:diguanylate cyclase domain-containing protein [Halochromatium glycolicum]|uniref:diguanylate cyclase n=1 Tax=Halochromatium glycolicum TaxID=85075 RepID=A0AAJ0U573_9GAMM|nr:diguanylate cyclase [Halochromatium glycolicum]MBK1705481.1 diguanylate cyclase response regulator [Halochromatium glycolicum]